MPLTVVEHFLLTPLIKLKSLTKGNFLNKTEDAVTETNDSFLKLRANWIFYFLTDGTNC